MNPFRYQRATSPEEALEAVVAHNAKFLGGGTNLVDLMRYGVEHPASLVDITRLDLTKIEDQPDGGVLIGALVRNSALASAPRIVKDYPLLSQALLSGATPQLRNMATTGGNLLQRTRCYYFMDSSYSACNKRVPGSGCSAVRGFHRIHAIVGQSDHGFESAETCIATNPSDMNVAMAALNAVIHVQGPRGKRNLPIAEFHRLPGKTPHVDTTLAVDELITHVELPAPSFAANSWYLKIRDRQSYAFALVSVAAGLEMSGGLIKSAGLALGGVAHKPWRVPEAEKLLIGARSEASSYTKAAEVALRGAKGYEHNAFKIEMAKQAIVRCLTIAAEGRKLSQSTVSMSESQKVEQA
jgi:xanthine dehydrogenase YagS FAD-binding subunit